MSAASKVSALLIVLVGIFSALQWLVFWWNSKRSRIYLRTGPTVEDFLWALLLWLPLALCAILNAIDDIVVGSRINALRSQIHKSKRVKFGVIAVIAVLHVVWMAVPLMETFGVGQEGVNPSKWPAVTVLKKTARYMIWPAIWDMCLCLLFTVRLVSPFGAMLRCYFQSLSLHRYLGWAALWTVSTHACLYLIAYIIEGSITFNTIPGTKKGWIVFPGLVGWTAQLIFSLLSFEYVRRRFFRAFILSHQLYIIFLAETMLHEASTVYHLLPALLFLISDRMIAWMLATFVGHHAQLTTYSNSDIIRVDVSSCRNMDVPRYYPGSYVRVEFPEISTESHPFSIGSLWNDTPGQITLYVRALGGWTRDLRRIADVKKMTSIRVRGLFANSPCQWISRSDRCMVFIAGGVGVVSFMPMLIQLMRAEGAAKKVKFYWVVRSMGDLEPFGDFIAAIRAHHDLIEFYLHMTREQVEIDPLMEMSSDSYSSDDEVAEPLLDYHPGRAIGKTKLDATRGNEIIKPFMFFMTYLAGVIAFFLARLIRFEDEFKCRKWWASFDVWLHCRALYILAPVVFACAVMILLNLLIIFVTKFAAQSFPGTTSMPSKVRNSTSAQAALDGMDIKKGRMDIMEELSGLQDTHILRRVDVYVSGPETMVQSAKQACRDLGPKFVSHRESFLV